MTDSNVPEQISGSSDRRPLIPDYFWREPVEPANQLPTPDQLITWADEHPIVSVLAGVLALAVLVLAFLVVRALVRDATAAVRVIASGTVSWVRRLTGRPVEDTLTVIAASIATIVAGQGMWQFLERVVGYVPWPLRALMFAFLEVAVITSAVRARRSMRDEFSAGIDGIAVWVLTSTSAVLSAMEARSLPEIAFRLAAPLVAAWLWERGMRIERRRITGRRGIHWRLTPERVLVRLGLADATDRTAEQVATQRLLTRVALAAHRARELRASGARAWRLRRALARLERAYTRAAQHAGLARSSALQEALAGEVAALYSAQALLDIIPESVWTRPRVTNTEAAALAAELRQWSATARERPDRESLAAVAMLAAHTAEQRINSQAHQPAPPHEGVLFAAPTPPATATSSAPGSATEPATSSAPDSTTASTATARMRAYWDEQIAAGRIPTGAELARVVGCSDQWGRKMRAIWKQQLTPEQRAQLTGAAA